MIPKILILGAGHIGKVIAGDLKDRYDVTCSDINSMALDEVQKKLQVKIIPCDFSVVTDLEKLIQPYDLIVCAVPGFIGMQTLKTIISSGKDVVDISYSPENSLELNELARMNNSRALVDCGIAPGLCNILAGYHDAQVPLTLYECLVGGLPIEPEWPYFYKTVFSPLDVIEEYTRPARLVEQGNLVVYEALTDIEIIKFDGFGKLESFNTDGLRSMIYTLSHVPEMREKTLRYPGHAELMKTFREGGFFSKVPVVVDKVSIRPIDLTSRLLFTQWEFKSTDRDITLMRITLENNFETIQYHLSDVFDEDTGTTSMARTTGYTCTAAVNLLLNGLYKETGVSPPEYLGKNEICFQYIINYLEEKNINLKKSHKVKTV